jgi:hypothetical protein
LMMYEMYKEKIDREVRGRRTWWRIRGREGEKEEKIKNGEVEKNWKR